MPEGDQVITGWKTRAAGIASILWGIWSLIDGRQDDGVRYIVDGLAIIGIGHKLDRING